MYYNKIIAYCLVLAPLLAGLLPASAQEQNLAEKLKGRILLQVEKNGEAWYVNPSDSKRYYLARPEDAWQALRFFGVGISDGDLKMIRPNHIGMVDDTDYDQDGLADYLEIALDSDPKNVDTDSDGYEDGIEVSAGYDPCGQGRWPTNDAFVKKHAGKIFLQVQGRGEAWYVDPVKRLRYFLGRPADALNVMRKFGLGIKNQDLDLIPAGVLPTIVKPTNNIPHAGDRLTSRATMDGAATAIRNNDVTKALTYFDPTIRNLVKTSIETFDNETRLEFANHFSGATLEKSSEAEHVYSIELYFTLGGYNGNARYFLNKQTDGTWLITNL